MARPTKKGRQRVVEWLGISFATAVAFSITAVATQEPAAAFIAKVTWVVVLVCFVLLVAYGVRHGSGRSRVRQAKLKGQSLDHH